MAKFPVWSRRVRPFVPALCLAALVITWASLSLGYFYMGTTEWDGQGYSATAMHPVAQYRYQNRYAHIWGLRFFHLLITDPKLAGATYATAMTCGTMIGAYVIGLRAHGVFMGLIAAALLPFAPELLRLPNSTLADPAMAAYSTAAVALAASARVVQRERQRYVMFLLSGALCFFAVKSKETGLAAIPAVFALAWNREWGWRPFAAWLAGVCGAWVILTILDALFLGDPWHSFRRKSYRPPSLTGIVKRSLPTKRATDYLTLLTTGFTSVLFLTGVAGMLQTGRRSLVMRSVAVWCVGAIVFMSLISWIYTRVGPQPRYLVVVQVALVISTSYLLADGLRAREGDGKMLSLPAFYQLAVVFFPAVFVLSGYKWIADSVAAGTRIEQLLSPFAHLTLLGGCVLTTVKWVRCASAVAFMGCFFFSAVADAEEPQAEVMAKVAPFDRVLRHFHANSRPEDVLHICRYDQIVSLSPNRLRRMLQVRTEKPITVTSENLRSLSQSRPCWYVLTKDHHGPEMERLGFVRLASGTFSGEKGDARRHTIYANKRRPDPRPVTPSSKAR